MSDDLKTLPEAEFKELESKVTAEAFRRKHEAAEAKRKRHDQHVEGLKVILTQDLLNVLLPNHERTSCSDNNRQSGSNDWKDVRCTRCALLDLVGHPYLLPDFLWVRLIILNQE